MSTHHTTARSRISRRGLILGASAGAAALALPVRAARAAQPDAATPHGGGYYTRPIGNARVTLLADGSASMPTPFFSIGAPDGAPEAALRKRFLPDNAVPLHFNALLIESEGSRILVDAGRGHGSQGMLLDNLRRAGATPESIDALIITHLHFDHIGGALDPAGKAVFPNAEVLLHENEREHWAGAPSLSDLPIPPEYREMIRRSALAFLDAYAPRIRTFTGDTRLTPHVTPISAPGHTPGHTLVHVADADESLLYIADALHVPAIQLENPGWKIAFDTDQSLAERTRRSVLARAADERALIAGSHIPFPSFGHVRASGTGFEFEPTIWNW